MSRVTAVVISALLVLGLLPGTALAQVVPPATQPATFGADAAAGDQPQWLTALNYLREQGGLDDVVEVGRLSEGALQHARYAVDHDFKGHTEDPALPGFTPEGKVAAEESNLVYHEGPLTAVESIYFWMGSITHLAWMIHPNLEHTGMGLFYRPDDEGLQTVGVLNVVDGINDRVSRPAAQAWPTDGGTVPLGQHADCPTGRAVFAMTTVAPDTAVSVTATNSRGVDLEVNIFADLAGSATGFTTCGVTAGETITWTAEVDGEPTQTHAVDYLSLDALSDWPIDPPMDTEFSIPNADSIDAPAFGLSRRDAATPTELAVTLADEVFESRGDADFAILSRDDNFADSLAGSALARFGPILFTPSGSLDGDVSAWLAAGLDPGDTVYLLGGEVALNPAVETAVAELGFNPVRLAGPSRTVTAVRVAEEALSVARTYFAANHPDLYASEDDWVAGRFNLARAGNWADAIAVAPYAAGLTSEGGGCCIAPVTLLTPKDSLDAGVEAFVAASSLHLATVLGGEAAVAGHVPAGLATTSVERHAGPDRAATAAEIGTNLLDLGGQDDTTGILLIDGDREDGWAWGLAATSYAFHHDMAILMVRNGSIPASTDAVLQNCVPVEILGDASVIPASVEAAVATRPC